MDYIEEGLGLGFGGMESGVGHIPLLVQAQPGTLSMNGVGKAWLWVVAKWGVYLSLSCYTFTPTLQQNIRVKGQASKTRFRE